MGSSTPQHIHSSEALQAPAEQKTSQQPTRRTLAIIKPDAVKAGATATIIDLIEKNHFIIHEIYKTQLTSKNAQLFYQEHDEKPFFYSLINFMISGPCVILVLEHSDASVDTVTAWRSLMGPTNPAKAPLGSLRYMFGTSVEHNAVHGSDSAVSAEREINFFFAPELPESPDDAFYLPTGINCEQALCDTLEDLEASPLGATH